jgi:hypothetical protein
MISLLTFKRNWFLLGALCALLLPAMSNAQSWCVHTTDDGGNQRRVPVSLGRKLHLNFTHSIYASQVEEIFLIRSNGFELTQLRYGEARLAEFYGFENSRLENGVWIVTPPAALLPALNLNLSNHALMSLRIEDKILTLQPARAHRVSVGACSGHGHD